jgi:hypothetical protein
VYIYAHAYRDENIHPNIYADDDADCNADNHTYADAHHNRGENANLLAIFVFIMRPTGDHNQNANSCRNLNRRLEIVLVIPPSTCSR